MYLAGKNEIHGRSGSSSSGDGHDVSAGFGFGTFSEATALGRDLRLHRNGFRLAFEATDDEVSPQLRLDFWSKTARTPSLLEIFHEHEKSLRASHLAGLQTSIAEGDLSADFREQLDLVEDLLQAFSLGIHTWASLHDSTKDRARALEIGRLFLQLLSSSD